MVASRDQADHVLEQALFVLLSGLEKADIRGILPEVPGPGDPLGLGHLIDVILRIVRLSASRPIGRATFTHYQAGKK
jgi:hypothetical protein